MAESLGGRFVLNPWGSSRVALSVLRADGAHLLGSIPVEFRQLFEVALALGHVPRTEWFAVIDAGLRVLHLPPGAKPHQMPRG